MPLSLRVCLPNTDAGGRRKSQSLRVVESEPPIAQLMPSSVNHALAQVHLGQSGSADPLALTPAAPSSPDNTVESTAVEADACVAREALRQSEERFRLLIENATDIISLLTPDGTILYESPAIERILGYHPNELVGQSAFSLIHPDDRESVARMFRSRIDQPGVAEAIELRFRHKDGSWCHLESVGNNMLAHPGINAIVVNSRDITERKAFEERLEHAAFHDPVTQLCNRSGFSKRLRESMRLQQSEMGAVAVLLLDLDNFKSANDLIGHVGGDRLLRSIAHRLEWALPRTVLVARWGGDEFALLAEQVTDRAVCEQLAADVLRALQAPFNIYGREIIVSASIGATLLRAGCVSQDRLVREADLALYEAKRLGKARALLFDESMSERSAERLSLAEDLRDAVQRGELSLHFQPIVRLDTQEVDAVEALLRWGHPRRGAIPPDVFIPVAEESDLILRIGRWVLHEACRQARTWPVRESGVAPRVSINLSARQFRDPYLVSTVRAALNEADLAADRLQIEITESAMMDDAESAAEVLRQLKDLGVRIAMDDFGTGYSSMAYLHTFPIDSLKIDRSFISRLGTETRDIAIVHTILALAQTLGLAVTAEGIETVEQCAALRELGCHLGQGYLFARPVPSDAVPALLRAGSVRCACTQIEPPGNLTRLSLAA
jgi:diguanylate cyclase (GGDEF)-like protein/PAS domain S-box-containing protein